MSETARVGGRQLVSITRVVPGRIWLLGKDWQDREKKIARDELDRHVARENLLLVSAVSETIRMDEKHRQVQVHYEAEAVQP